MSAAALLDMLDRVQQCGTDRWRAVCPAHESKHGTRSLTVTELSDGTTLIRCHAACAAADVLGAVGLTFAALFPKEHRAPQPPRPAQRPNHWQEAPRVARSDCTDWSRRAADIWQRTQPIRGTLGEIYLHHRNCALPPPDSDLRYLPPSGNFGPTLCARVTDVATGEPISLHFTRLAADGRGKAGTEQDKTLLAAHRKRGGCIRLWPDESVTFGLAIAEGIETALAAAHGFVPVWSMVDAGNMVAFPVLRGINALTIFADHDDAGITAAERCAQRWADAGREARIVMPQQKGTDMADVLAEVAA